MTDTDQITELDKVQAAKNEWGKIFKLGDRDFEIKDLPYFDYIEFMQLARPLISLAAGAVELDNEGGEIKAGFDPTKLDFDEIFKLCGKELPKMGQLICKQSAPGIKPDDVANLARRPQRLIELVLMQILHNNMIEEFGSFFSRLTAMVTVMMPDLAKTAAPSELPSESKIEETLSSS
jgi:hypothetical protein